MAIFTAEYIAGTPARIHAVNLAVKMFSRSIWPGYPLFKTDIVKLYEKKIIIII